MIQLYPTCSKDMQSGQLKLVVNNNSLPETITEMSSPTRSIFWLLCLSKNGILKFFYFLEFSSKLYCQYKLFSRFIQIPFIVTFYLCIVPNLKINVSRMLKATNSRLSKRIFVNVIKLVFVATEIQNFIPPLFGLLIL